MSLYENENYHFRNTLTDILTNVIEFLVLNQEAVEEHDIETV
jgi:hypothetical protein